MQRSLNVSLYFQSIAACFFVVHVLLIVQTMSFHTSFVAFSKYRKIPLRVTHEIISFHFGPGQVLSGVSVLYAACYRFLSLSPTAWKPERMNARN